MYVSIIESAPHNVGKTKIYEGVAGTLFAYVAQKSFEAGFDGFVLFESKTNLYQYYQEKYGALPTRDRWLHFDTKASIKLIETYLEGENVS
jgi:hypothetical protein